MYAVTWSAVGFAESVPLLFALAALYGTSHGLVEGAGRRDYVFSGEPVDGCSEAEHHAQAGEVVARRGSEFVRITKAPAGKSANLPVTEADAVAVRPFLHPLLWEALESGQAAFLNEHRHITVLFAAFQPRDGAAGEAAAP